MSSAEEEVEPESKRYKVDPSSQEQVEQSEETNVQQEEENEEQENIQACDEVEEQEGDAGEERPKETEHYWFKFAEEAFVKDLGQEVKLRDDLTDEEIGLTAEQRAKVEKRHNTKQNRQNWIVRDTISGKIFLVKQSYNVERAHKEWLVNQLLREFNIPHTIPAICWFEGKEGDEEDPTDGFMVVPFVKIPCWDDIFVHYKFASEEELNGVITQILETFASFDPGNLENPLRIVYRDKHDGQMMFNPETKEWFLIDFGLVDAVYLDKTTNKYVEINMTDSLSPPREPVVRSFIFSFTMAYPTQVAAFEFQLNTLPPSPTIYKKFFPLYLKRKSELDKEGFEGWLQAQHCAFTKAEDNAKDIFEWREQVMQLLDGMDKEKV